MDETQLVESVVREVLRRLGREERLPLVLLLCDRDEDTAAKVRSALDETVEIAFCGETIDGRMPERHVLPFLSCTDMADLAAGRASSRFATEALGLLLRGQKVEVLEFEYVSHAETAPQALYDLYAGHKKTLAAYGLHALRRKGPEVLTLRTGLATEKDVRQAKAQGALALAVPATALITPLAVDTAAELGLNILKRL